MVRLQGATFRTETLDREQLKRHPFIRANDHVFVSESLLHIQTWRDYSVYAILINRLADLDGQ